MSHKQGQEHHSSYMDGVRVKISEQYKPPPKIILPMSYSQRITLNKQIQDNIPRHDFTLERTVKEKMREWREARTIVSNQRKERLEQLKQVRAKELEENVKKEQEYESESDYNLNNTGVLIPTQVTATSTNILTPTPLGDLKVQQFSCKPVDKSPFNISDFEADTSSPFDNMALKTINDMAELALVLQNEEKPATTSINQAYSYNVPLSSATFTQTFNTNYSNPQQYLYQQIPSTSTTPYIQPTNSYSASNGYYYDANYAPSYMYNNRVQNYDTSFDVPSPQKNLLEDNKTLVNKVPDIMKALQAELNNIHVKSMENSQPIIVNHVSSSHKIENARNNVESKSETTDECYRNLPRNLQNLSKEISGMGFPLSRVARVCNVIGDDHKKIVEHLLAMSDLLDLGFSETKVSKALLECNNDRDKALDKLIL